MLIEQVAAHRLGTARFELPGLPSDLRVDLEVADQRDLATARAAVKVMMKRGFARKKNLERILERFIRATR
jgi:hypothetical protein